MAKVLIVGTNTMALYNHRRELIMRLREDGLEVVIVAPSGGEERELISMGCKFINTSIDTRGLNVLHDIKLLLRLVSIIRKERPDVILTFYTKTNIYGGMAARITRTPYIENITGLGTALAHEGFSQKSMLALYRIALKKAGMIFFQNKQNEDFFHSRGIREDVGILLPGSGVSLRRYQPLPYPEGDDVEFLFISRVLKEKGIYEYIEAARQIRREFPNTKFHVAGPADHDYQDAIAKAVSEGLIIYYGKVYDIHPLLEMTHCTVFPSYYPEGMANILLESSASGRPVITTDCPGCGETLTDGVTGYVVRPHDADDLVDKMRTFIRLPYSDKKNMGLAGRKKMEAEFDRDIVIDEYLNQITKILNARKG